MSEYINREDAISAVKHAWAKGLEPSQYIEIIPAADVVEERHGKWELDEEKSKGHAENIYICTACRICEAWGEAEKTRYCPNCGAKMDLED